MGEPSPIGERFRATLEAIRARREALTTAAQEEVRRSVAAWEEQQRLELPHHLKRCGAPDRAISFVCAPDLKRDSPAMRAVLRFGEPEVKARFLVLHGVAGCGKSVAACYALTYAADDYVLQFPIVDPVTVKKWNSANGAWTTATTLDYSNPWDDDGRALMQRMTRARWAVLDDLGTEVPKDGGRWMEKLDHIVDQRYSRNLKTVLTTNLDPATFRKLYKERISDRLVEAGVFVPCGTESLRRAP